MDVDALNKNLDGFFPSKLGFDIVESSQDLIKTTLSVRDDLCNGAGIMHGGAIMTLADTMGALGTMMNLPPGAGTTTIESKTNFFAAMHSGETISAECTPLHRGKRTMVWQTRIHTEKGKLAALITQTQIVLSPS